MPTKDSGRGATGQTARRFVRHGCERPDAALTAIAERKRLYAASRVRYAGLQTAQPALDPASRRSAVPAKCCTSNLNSSTLLGLLIDIGFQVGEVFLAHATCCVVIQERQEHEPTSARDRRGLMQQ